jgi:hypothetical protein
MGVRTRGLDIKAGAAKLKADRAARLELANATRFRLSSAVVNVYPDGVDEAGSPQ